VISYQHFIFGIAVLVLWDDLVLAATGGPDFAGLAAAKNVCGETGVYLFQFFRR
jgi:hypothetical protein